MEWHQSSSTSTAMARPAEGEAAGERKARPQKEQVLNCPRCNSANTKFCYYNNYSLSQPRYFCKTCRRYWTEGGSLRNVPVGGGSRKNKRPSSSPAAAAASTSGISTIVPPGPKKLLLPGVSGDFIPSGSVPSISLSATRTAHKLMQDGVQGLKLGFPHLAVVPLPDLSATRSSGMGLLRPFMPLPPLPELYSSSAFGLMQELIRAPPLSFPTDATGGGIRAVSAGFGALEMDNSAITRRHLFPFEDVKPLVVHDPTNSTAAAAAASAAEFQMVSGRSSHAGVRRRFGATPLAMEVEPKKAGERNIHHINQSVELKIKSNQTNGFLISEREY